MRAARTRTAAAVLLAASLALAGCGAGSADTASDGRRGAAAEPADAGAADRSAAEGGAGAAGKPASKPAAGQHVIRTASLSVEVKDAAKALVTARRVAADAGGHVENESTERVDDAHLASQIVLRVPQERYDSVLAELAGTGRLLDRRAEAKDVTDRVVDVESRIATQRASVARVRTLMDRAEKLSDVVTLEGELSRRQADLEALLAQRASLKDRTTMATITLRLSEKEKPPAEEPEEGRPGFGDALSGGWNALVGAAAWIGIVLTALAPWLAVALVVFVLWRRLVRPRLAARPRPAAPAPALPDAPRNAAGAPAGPASPKPPQPREAPEK
ncbi:hypothetical protein GCM10010275_54370 [Streptomyces litmocidini]|uniref:DUF4349 domain-containing protein n=1 Tax=Streptomyces litmocidini TaxID=67318 RepID=UPI00199D61C6|nr:DUF4349 domain-containing protein [Streptomyces litmocidini]GGV07319.1 hypothetical protein GCM10010275_54370 [Streptomyces litmocidini]